LIWLRFPIPRLDVDDLHDSIFVVNPVASSSRTQLKAGSLQNVAKVVEREILVRSAAKNSRGELSALLIGDFDRRY